jgi:hypothetical protein
VRLLCLGILEYTHIVTNSEDVSEQYNCLMCHTPSTQDVFTERTEKAGNLLHFLSHSDISCDNSLFTGAFAKLSNSNNYITLAYMIISYIIQLHRLNIQMPFSDSLFTR